MATKPKPKPNVTAPNEKTVAVETAEPLDLPAKTSHKEPERALSPIEAMAKQMREAGLGEVAVLAALNAQFGGGDPAPGQPTPATPGSGETLGPDPRLVAEYKERMKNYTPRPKLRPWGCLSREDTELEQLIRSCVQDVDNEMSQEGVVQMFLERLDGFGGVALPAMFLEWCVQWQYWQHIQRRMPASEAYSEAQVIEDMIRYHWHAHPQERAQLQAAKGGILTSGPAKAFNAGAGDWSKR